MFPIESNPQVMNEFLTHLGVPNQWRIVDVLSIDKELLGLIPQPALALILLFPTSVKFEEFRKKREEKIIEQGQDVSPELYHLKQKIPNTCGTVALVHSVANNLDSIQLEDGFFKRFIEDTKSMTPEERGVALESSKDFVTAHEEIAAEGQSQIPTDNNDDHRFVTLVCKDGILYEIDGTRPINHGPSSAKTFIEDAAKVIIELMNIDPDELKFSVCALATPFED